MSDSDIPRLPRRNKVEDPKMIGLWKIGRTIGKGSSGRVKIARHSKTGQYAAIKIISKSSFGSRTSEIAKLADQTEQSQLAIEREIVVMKLINHPNIMRLFDVWETSTELYLVLEYIQGGELFEHLCNKGRLSTSEALNYFQQIISAVDYCHQFNICHRDLKPENILLDKDFNIKIADFGMAAWLASSEGGLLETSCGSPHYAAPEIISGNPYRGSASDIWSCGVILHALLAGRLPFDDEDCLTLLEKVVKGKFDMPHDIDPRAKDLIARMLWVDVPKRITMPEIIAHPFFNLIPPKNIREVVPSLNIIAKPLPDATSIDPDILANLRTLWHGTPDNVLIESLTNSTQTWQKGVYHLLVEFRRKCSVNSEQEAEDIIRIHAERKRKRQEEKEAALQRRRSIRSTEIASPSLTSLPARSGPPTPRRASRISQLPDIASASEELNEVPLELETIPDVDLEGEAIPTSPAAVDLSPLSPLLDALGLSSVTGQDLQNEEVQTFFQNLLQCLTALQARGGLADAGPTPNLHVMNSLLGLQSRNPNIEDLVGRAPGLSLDPSNSATKPLTIRRKGRPFSTDYGLDDKENQAASAKAKRPKRNSLLGRVERKISIVEPVGRALNRVRSRKGRNNVKDINSPIHGYNQSPVPSSVASSFSLPPASPSSPVSTSPKRRWLSNVFKFRSLTPSSVTLYSTFDSYTTRNECRRLLMNMNVRVALDGSGCDGLGLLKCRVQEGSTKEGSSKFSSVSRPGLSPLLPLTSNFSGNSACGAVPSSGPTSDKNNDCCHLKSVKFRVELQRTSTSQTENYGHLVALTFIHERGSVDSYKEVCKRMQKEWTLSEVGSIPSSAVLPSPARDANRAYATKFVEVV
ncbi:Pkinase-domain-containing protein [Pluteus cervinus]|uniref:Pkinase-domain-containing protein n=1 Tax=Pluteus cervinus TaxID=181527 RepID=A0ACD3B015_9AGAR|nr:Pkinase-domain-containing protein [Pluteus cervinus]